MWIQTCKNLYDSLLDERKYKFPNVLGNKLKERRNEEKRREKKRPKGNPIQNKTAHSLNR